MMDELKEVKQALNPTEVLLVVDAMTGQEAAGGQKLELLYLLTSLLHASVIYCMF